MNTLSRTLLKAGLMLAAVLTPAAAFAQAVNVPDAPDQASGAIGLLVVWLLAIGGILAIAAAFMADRSAKTSRVNTTRR